MKLFTKLNNCVINRYNKGWYFEVEIVLLHTVRSKEMWEGAHPPKYDLKGTADAVSFNITCHCENTQYVV